MTTSLNRQDEAVSEHAGDKPLVPRRARYDVNLLSDLIALMMANVEDALLEAGAKPALDYNHLDLLKEASPFVLSMVNSYEGDQLQITCEWPHQEGEHSGFDKGAKA